MLSRVAERIYWLSRYLERVENTARLMGVYTNLLLDLPEGVNIGWYNLVTLNDAEHWYDARYKVRNERNVMKFLLSDPDYPGSMVRALQMVRENIRTSRDVVPGEAWEYVNELSLYVNDNLQRGINRGQRHDFIAHIIRSCQQLLGSFVGSMSEGQPKTFMRVGRNVERADMTTRLLDAGVAVQLGIEDSVLATTEQIIWVNVLNSLSAYLPYTKSQRKSVKGPRVAHYLLEDRNFPRAVDHCMLALEQQFAAALPRNEEFLKRVELVLNSRYDFLEPDAPLGEPFQHYLNDLQLKIADLHHVAAETWFALD